LQTFGSKRKILFPTVKHKLPPPPCSVSGYGPAAVLGTMALQLIEVFQCSMAYSMKQTSSFFDCCNTIIDFIVCVAA